MLKSGKFFYGPKASIPYSRANKSSKLEKYVGGKIAIKRFIYKFCNDFAINSFDDSFLAWTGELCIFTRL